MASPFGSPLDDLVAQPGAAGDTARSVATDPPLPGETPDDTQQRVRTQAVSFARNQAVKARDLAAKGIPSFSDNGAVTPVTDETGTALTGFDKKNSIGYDSSGNPRTVGYDAGGRPQLGDPFAGIPTTLDNKTGDQYQIVPGLPWRFAGTDAATKERIARDQQDRELKQQRSVLGQVAPVEKNAIAAINQQVTPLVQQLSEAGVTLAKGDTPDVIRKKVDDAFQYGDDANKTTFWGHDLTPEALAARADTDAKKAQAHAIADKLDGLYQQVQEHRGRMAQVTSARDSASTQLLQNEIARLKASGADTSELEKLIPQTAQTVQAQEGGTGGDATAQNLVPGLIGAAAAQGLGEIKADGALATFGKAFGDNILPAVGTAAGGIGGALAGTAVGGPGVGTVVGDVAGGAAGGMLVRKLQDEMLGAEDPNQEAANKKAHPWAYAAGNFVPFLLSMFGGGPVTSAAKTAAKAGVPLKAGTAAARIEGAASAAVGGARAGLSEGAQEHFIEGKDDVNPLDTMARGAISMGSMGWIKPAKTILMAATGKAVKDAAAVTLAGNMYDYAVHGKPINFQKISDDMGGSIPAFMIQNAIMGVLHGQAKPGSAGAGELPGAEPTPETGGPAPATPPTGSAPKTETTPPKGGASPEPQPQAEQPKAEPPLKFNSQAEFDAHMKAAADAGDLEAGLRAKDVGRTDNSRVRKNPDGSVMSGNSQQGAKTMYGKWLRKAYGSDDPALKDLANAVHENQIHTNEQFLARKQASAGSGSDATGNAGGTEGRPENNGSTAGGDSPAGHGGAETASPSARPTPPRADPEPSGRAQGRPGGVGEVSRTDAAEFPSAPKVGEEAAAKPRSKSSTQVNLPAEDAKAVSDFTKAIPDSAIYKPETTGQPGGFGREDEPHVTALYGITHDDAGAIAQAVGGKHGPVKLTLGKVSKFTNNPNYDVLKVDVDSPELHALNKTLKGQPNENDYPDYHPHLTLAYVKKGAANDLVGSTHFEGRKITVPSLTFSDHNRKQTAIPLRGDKATAPLNPAPLAASAAAAVATGTAPSAGQAQGDDEKKGVAKHPTAPSLAGVEHVTGTALKTPDGIQIGPEPHTPHAGISIHNGGNGDPAEAQRGFLVHSPSGKQRFVSRKAAMFVAKRAGQIAKDHRGDKLNSDDVAKFAAPATASAEPVRAPDRSLQAAEMKQADVSLNDTLARHGYTTTTLEHHQKAILSNGVEVFRGRAQDVRNWIREKHGNSAEQPTAQPVEPAPEITKAAEAQADKPDTAPAKMKVQKEFLLGALDKAHADATVKITPEWQTAAAKADMEAVRATQRYDSPLQKEKPDAPLKHKVAADKYDEAMQEHGARLAKWHGKLSAELQPLFEKYGIPATSPEKSGFTDLDATVHEAVPAQPIPVDDGPIIEDGRTLDRVQMLEDAIRKADGDARPKITIEVPGDGTFEIVNTQQAIAEFRKTAARHFPVSAQKPEEVKATTLKPSAIPALSKPKKLGDYIEAAAPAMSTDSTRYVLNGVFSDGKHLIATDGRRLILIEHKGPGTAEKPVLFMGKALKQTPAEKVGKYPNYQQVIPQEFTHSVKLKTGDFYRALKAADAMTSEKSLSVVLMLNPPGSEVPVGLVANSPDVGEYQGNVEPGAKPLVAINPQFAMDAMRAARMLGHETITLHAGDDRSPLLFSAPGFKNVIMPMRFESSRLDVMKHAQAVAPVAPKKEKTKPSAAEISTTSTPPPAAAPKPAEGIADFGEKLGGARKDIAASMAREISDDDIARLPLSEIWPKSEVDAIADIPLAALATAVRAEIPAKPRQSYKVQRWAEKVKQVRGLMKIAGERGYDAVIAKMGEYNLGQLVNKIRLLQSVPREHWDRVGGVADYPDAYQYTRDAGGKQVFENGQMAKTPTPFAEAEIDGKRVGAANLSELTDKVNAKLSDAAPAERMKFEVRGREGKGWFINKTGDPLYRKLKTFEDSKAALAFARDPQNYGVLKAAWDAVKESDNVKETDVRRETNRDRSGKDWRDGKDATPEMFTDSFGFRGAEFGNWVSQGKNLKERQGMLNAAFDAFHDLADTLGIPSKAISLNGTLGLGFGSRGHGWAAAHFEPGNLVIAMTKTRGAGSLGHEWFHALDNYFQRQRNERGIVGRHGDYITNNPETYYESPTGQRISENRYREVAKRPYNAGKMQDWKRVEGVRPQVAEAFADLVKALDASPMAKRAALIDKGKSDGYWSRIIERAARSFENYVIAKMQLAGTSNDYLANVASVEDFARDKGRYPYLLPDEIAPVAAAFDQLFGTLETKETEKGVALHANQPHDESHEASPGNSLPDESAGAGGASAGSDRADESRHAETLARLGAAKDFLARRNGLAGHFARLGLRPEAVGPDEAPGGLATTRDGRLFYNRERFAATVERLSPWDAQGLQEMTYIEEMLHQSQFLAVPMDDANAALWWSLLPQDTRDLMKRIYPAPLADWQNYGEYLARLAMVRLGYPMPEHFHNPKAETLWQHLAQPQNAQAERQVKAITEMFLNGSAEGAKQRGEGVLHAGYRDDFSKSNNAADAEADGRYPASVIAKKLGVPIGFIKEHAPHGGEWHHTSKFYNAVNYYDLADVDAWMKGEGDHAVEGDEPTGGDLLAEYRVKQKALKADAPDVLRGQSIKYLEWGGTRNHPRATERTLENVSIERKPGQKMVTITTEAGKTFKKALDTRGFQIRDRDGKFFNADSVFSRAADRTKNTMPWPGLPDGFTVRRFPHPTSEEHTSYIVNDKSGKALPKTGGTSPAEAVQNWELARKFGPEQYSAETKALEQKIRDTGYYEPSDDERLKQLIEKDRQTFMEKATAAPLAESGGADSRQSKALASLSVESRAENQPDMLGSGQEGLATSKTHPENDQGVEGVNEKGATVSDKLRRLNPGERGAAVNPAEAFAKVKKAMTPGLDAIGDTVRGVQSLLLPSAVSAEHLARAVEVGKHLGAMHRREEQDATALRNDWKHFVQLGVTNERTPLKDNPGIKAMSDISQGRALTGQVKEFAARAKGMFDRNLALLEQYDAPVEKVRENYFPGVWTKPSIRAFGKAMQELADKNLIPEGFDINDAPQAMKDAVAKRVAELLKAGEEGKNDNGVSFFSKRPLKGSEGFRRQKVFDDIMTGAEFGLVPISNNPVDIVKTKLAEMNRSIMANGLLREWEKSGQVVAVGNDGVPMAAGKAKDFNRDEWDKLNDKYGTIWRRGDKGELIKQGERRARRPAADILNNYLSSSLYNNRYFGKPYSAWMAFANVLNQAQLGVGSAFHAGFTAAEAQISAGANVLKDIFGAMRGNRSLGDLAKTLAEFPVAIYRTYKDGDAVLNAWRKPDGTMDQRMRDVARAWELSGGGFTMEHGLRTGQTAKAYQDWHGGHPVRAMLRSPFAAIELLAKPIMDWLVPRQKAGVFAHLASRIIEQNPGKTMEELAPEFRAAAMRIDARLGQVRYDRLFINNTAKNLMHFLVRAPGWTGGTIAELGGAFKDLGGFVKQWAKTGKLPKDIPDRAAYALSLLLVVGLANALLTYLLTGTTPKGNDFFAFRTGRKDERGNPERYTLPTYMKDLWAYAHDPVQTLKNKLNPTLGLASELHENRDYYGVQIADPDASTAGQWMQRITHGAKAFVPFWMRGVKKADERGAGLGEKIAPLIGVMPAPAAMNQSAAMRLASEINKGKMGGAPMTEQQAERRTERTGVINQLRQGNTGALPQAIQQGKLKSEDAARIRATASLPPLAAAVKHMTLEEATRVFNRASPAERRMIEPLLAQKRAKAAGSRVPMLTHF